MTFACKESRLRVRVSADSVSAVATKKQSPDLHDGLLLPKTQVAVGLAIFLCSMRPLQEGRNIDSQIQLNLEKGGTC